ncbi:MAG: helix-turn-helix domain-containing protein [Oscillospiraceae bacterium]
MKLSYFTNDDSFPFFIQYGCHREKMYVHGHEDFFELVIVMSGKAEHIVGGDRFEISRGDVFAIGKNARHGYENTTQDFRICNIMFRPEALINADYDIKQLAGFHALFLLEPALNSNRCYCAMRLGYADFARLTQLTDAAVSECGAADSGRKTILLAYFLQIAVLLSRLYEAPKLSGEAAAAAIAAAFMEREYANQITAAELIRLSNYSARHFNRLFYTAYGTTPMNYLADIRIRRACALLRETALPIAEIAVQCGFGDPNYFSRIFRKKTGITPSKYRTQTQKGESI